MIGDNGVDEKRWADVYEPRWERLYDDLINAGYPLPYDVESKKDAVQHIYVCIDELNEAIEEIEEAA